MAGYQPNLPEAERDRLVKWLMDARRRVRSRDLDAIKQARRDVDAAKRALGERGPVWWTDGACDHNRRMVVNTPYTAWFSELSSPASGLHQGNDERLTSLEAEQEADR